MTWIKNVAIIGAGGAVGSKVVDAIVKLGHFNVTILTRTGSASTFPSTVKVETVDYSDPSSLTEALRGIDAVVSTVAFGALEVQIIAIDAAVAAGVKLFLPSEFGYDNSNAKTAALTADLPIFGSKITVNKHLEEKAASNPDFSYTLVETGAFIDWGLEKSFIFDLQSGKPRIFDGGDVPFSVTTLETAAQAVLGVLEHPDETKNRAVHVQDRTITQNKILALSKKVTPEKTKSWEPVPTSTASIKTAADAALAKGNQSLLVLFEYLFVTFFAEGYGGEYKTLDNELLGVAGDMTDAEVEDILTHLLK